MPTTQLTAGVTQLSAEYIIWNDEIKRCLERQAKLKSNKKTVFSTIGLGRSQTQLRRRVVDKPGKGRLQPIRKDEGPPPSSISAPQERPELQTAKFADNQRLL